VILFVSSHLLRQHKHDPLEEFLNSLLEDVIHKETTAIVKDVAKDIVNEHMEKAAAYNEIQNMIGQVIQEMGPDVVSISAFYGKYISYQGLVYLAKID